MRSFYFITGLALVSSLPALAQTSTAPQTPPQAPIGQLVQDPITEPIQKNDHLRVIVAGEVKYSAELVTVSEDGTIELPFIGQVLVANNPTGRAARFIESRLKSAKYLKNPSVTVLIVARKAREVIVNGAVAGQGRRVLREGTRLSDVLEEANPAPLADLEHVEVLRGKATLKIDYKKYRNGQDSSQTTNPMLEDGDRVYVRLGQPTEGSVKIVGEVKDLTKPLLPITEGNTVSYLLSMVGGITELGDRKNVFLLRKGQRIPVPYEEIVAGASEKDIKLQDKDEIYVPRLEKPRQYTVYGGVRTPGPFPLQGKITVLQAVANAGPLEGAKRKDIQLARRLPDGSLPEKATKINLENGKQAALEIQDGDVLYIPDPSRKSGFDFNQALSTVGSLIWIRSLIR
ncbi:polysaccharide biosynthesis/export family protein [Armatimonas rosea]|uniref:Protein involved in polysaccharide export with SLBB domain n=1 Tax=Armatimonas rosea TaxID=685828 RepID=A0A7W9SU69_ARMRO|nr:polysaccharide biosynthesis/export family protein [Armatimonas rosea]MBB6052731.1 protein involved in polysaccharide export with SLBB domain [Armatimonas rosea]